MYVHPGMRRRISFSSLLPRNTNLERILNPSFLPFKETKEREKCEGILPFFSVSSRNDHHGEAEKREQRADKEEAPSSSLQKSLCMYEEVRTEQFCRCMEDVNSDCDKNQHTYSLERTFLLSSLLSSFSYSAVFKQIDGKSCVCLSLSRTVEATWRETDGWLDLVSTRRCALHAHSNTNPNQPHPYLPSLW